MVYSRLWVGCSKYCFPDREIAVFSNFMCQLSCRRHVLCVSVQSWSRMSGGGLMIVGAGLSDLTKRTGQAVLKSLQANQTQLQVFHCFEPLVLPGRVMSFSFVIRHCGFTVIATLAVYPSLLPDSL